MILIATQLFVAMVAFIVLFAMAVGGIVGWIVCRERAQRYRRERNTLRALCSSYREELERRSSSPLPPRRAPSQHWN